VIDSVHTAARFFARALGVLFLALIATGEPHGIARAQALGGTAQTVPAPDDLAPAVRSALAPGGARVVSGATTLDLWWVALGAASWDAVQEGTLVGALRVTGPFADIRGKVVKPGVYTLRFGLQPQNGDHLGAAPNREFLLLCPAAADRDAKPLDFDGLVAIAKQTTGTSHPASLSLDPPTTKDQPLSSYATEENDLRGVVFEAGKLRFGLVLRGKIEP
jgi:hypothetical protein